MGKKSSVFNKLLATKKKLAYESLDIQFLTVFLWVGEFIFTLGPKCVVVSRTNGRQAR